MKVLGILHGRRSAGVLAGLLLAASIPATGAAAAQSPSSEGFNKSNYNHNKGWARDLFSDIVVVKGGPGQPTWLFLSGFGAEDPESTERGQRPLLGTTFEEQTRAAFTKIKSALAAHGATMGDIVRMTGYVRDRSNLRAYFKIQGEMLDGAPRPPHTFLEIPSLAGPNMLVEIEVTAVVPPGR